MFAFFHWWADHRMNQWCVNRIFVHFLYWFSCQSISMKNLTLSKMTMDDTRFAAEYSMIVCNPSISVPFFFESYWRTRQVQRHGRMSGSLIIYSLSSLSVFVCFQVHELRWTPRGSSATHDWRLCEELSSTYLSFSLHQLWWRLQTRSKETTIRGKQQWRALAKLPVNVVTLKGLQFWHQLIYLLTCIVSEDWELFRQEGLICKTRSSTGWSSRNEKCRWHESAVHGPTFSDTSVKILPWAKSILLDYSK